LHLVRRLDGRSRALAEINLRLVVRAASRTICVSGSELADVESVVGETDKLVLVRNGVAPAAAPTPAERAAARAGLGLSEAVTVGLYLAALDPHKEPLVAARAALAAARNGTPLLLLFAGDGPLRGDVAELAEKGSVLRLLGYQSDVRRVLSAVDFVVLPSRREGLSFSLLEAMAFGLPSIVSDAPGNTEAVGDAGLVVPSGDVEGFAQAMQRLSNDPAVRGSLGERARRRVEDEFSLEQMLEDTRRVYDKVISGAHGG
jgi:glycosyltransferase involved in cell wall biosynthesis